MTTNFALSLSFEGIQLLHRVTGGWTVTGKADVQSDNLDASLADLRQKAIMLEPGGLRTKLVIPLDQIKYLALDTTQTTMDDIHAALDGATPYGLDDLVIDCERRGGRTHIAAVARETLEEAEAFARAHKFNPVSFVAIPEPFTFQSEVFFGPTSCMTDVLGKDGDVSRDVLPIMIAGTRVKSRLLIFDIPEEALSEAKDADLFDMLAPEVADPSAEPESETSVIDDLPSIAEPSDLAPAAEPFVLSNELTVNEDASEEVEAAAETIADDGVQTTTPQVDDEIASSTPDLIAEEIPDTPEEPPLPLFEAEDVEIAVEAKDPDLSQLPSPIAVDPIIAEYHAARPKYHRTRRRVVGPRTPVSLTSPPDTPAMAAAIPAAPTPPARAPQTAATGSRKVLMGTAIAASVLFAGFAAWMQFGQSSVEDVANVPDIPAREAATVEDAATLIIPEQPVQASVAPTGPGPVVPAQPLAFPAPPAPLDISLALPAESPGPTILQRPKDILATAPDRAHAIPQAPPAPPEIQENQQVEVGAPVLRGRVLSPDEAATIYATTGVWQRAPRNREVPQVTFADGLTWPDPMLAPDRVAPPIVPDATELTPELTFVAPADPPPPEATFTLNDDGFVAATPEGAVTPEGAIVIAGLPDLAVRPRPELTPEDSDRLTLLAPAPDGVVVQPGPPPVTPPVRPSDAALPDNDEQEATPGAVSLAGLQPQTDADTLQDPQDAVPTGPRPQLRPAGLPTQLPPADLPSNPDITSVIAGIAEEEAATAPLVDATDSAVSASRRPDTRPQNFATVVANARPPQQAVPAPTPEAVAVCLLYTSPSPRDRG